MRPKMIMLTIVCSVAIAGMFGPGRQSFSGQESNRQTACGCYVCGFIVDFPVKPPGCYGTLATDACPVALARMPEEQRQAYCRKIKAEGKDSCPGYASICDPEPKNPEDKKPPEKKCEKPAPWFGSSSNCSEVQSPVVAINAGALTLTICGYPIFRRVLDTQDPFFVETYKALLENSVRERVGNKICCTKLREAARTGTPCYPAVDIDCDGKPNQTDTFDLDQTPYPDIDGLFSVEAPVDPFPSGFNPDDPNFLPPPEKCDCNWELVKGTRNCSPDRRQRHFYEAKWRCPSTGNERYTRKYAAPTAPCI